MATKKRSDQLFRTARRYFQYNSPEDEKAARNVATARTMPQPRMTTIEASEKPKKMTPGVAKELGFTTEQVPTGAQDKIGKPVMKERVVTNDGRNVARAMKIGNQTRQNRINAEAHGTKLQGSGATVITVGGKKYYTVEEAMRAASAVGNNNARAAKVIDAVRRTGRGDLAGAMSEKYYGNNYARFNEGKGFTAKEVNEQVAAIRKQMFDDRGKRTDELKKADPRGRFTSIMSYEDSVRAKRNAAGEPPTTGAGGASVVRLPDNPPGGSLVVAGGGRRSSRGSGPVNTHVSAISTFKGGKDASIKDRGSAWSSGGWSGSSGSGWVQMGSVVHIDPTAPKGSAYRDPWGRYLGGEYVGNGADGRPIFTKGYDKTTSQVERSFRRAEQRVEREETVKRNAWYMSDEYRLARAQARLNGAHSRLMEGEANRQRRQLEALAELASYGETLDNTGIVKPTPQAPAQAPKQAPAQALAQDLSGETPQQEAQARAQQEAQVAAQRAADEAEIDRWLEDYEKAQKK